MHREVQIKYPEPAGVQNSQAATIKQGSNQPRLAFQAGKQRTDFINCQDGWHVLWLFGSDDVDQPLDFLLKYFLVKEKQCRLCL